MKRKLLFLFLIFSIFGLPSYSAIKGGLEYSIPIDYTKLNEDELQAKAGLYYNLALKNGANSEDMTTALNLYHMLAHKNHDNVIYLTKLGTLYDIAGKDRYAKGAFFDAMGIKPNEPEAYYRLGEFYYKRQMYKKALRFYSEAYKFGYTQHYETVYKLGDIYEKFGDTRAALKYLRQASTINANSALDDKLTRVENADKINREYYSNTRIHPVEVNK